MRLPDSWSKARVTVALVVVTAAAWLLVALFRLDDWAVVWGGFMARRAWLYGDDDGAGAVLADAADRDLDP